MICQKCQQRPANVHITQLINGKKQELHLCEQCSKAININLGFPAFPIHNLKNLMGFVSLSPAAEGAENQASKCPTCQISYRRIGETGFVGCSDCYNYFSSQLEGVLRKIHGSNRHSGKLPQRAGAGLVLRREAAELKRKLQKAVEHEEYEEAARLRDKLRDMEARLNRGEKGD